MHLRMSLAVYGVGTGFFKRKAIGFILVKQRATRGITTGSVGRYAMVDTVFVGPGDSTADFYLDDHRLKHVVGNRNGIGRDCATGINAGRSAAGI